MEPLSVCVCIWEKLPVQFKIIIIKIHNSINNVFFGAFTKKIFLISQILHPLFWPLALIHVFFRWSHEKIHADVLIFLLVLLFNLGIWNKRWTFQNALVKFLFWLSCNFIRPFTHKVKKTPTFLFAIFCTKFLRLELVFFILRND